MSCGGFCIPLDGRMFARYLRASNPAPAPPERIQEKGSSVPGNYIEVFNDVTPER